MRQRWLPAPPRIEPLRSTRLGLVVNDADPYSVEVGAYYARRRGLAPAQVLHVELRPGPVLAVDEFERLRDAIAGHFGADIQALALAWKAPYAVGCESITGALALGYDPLLCRSSCAPSAPSPYFDSPSRRPFADFGFRLSMLVAAPDVEAARALIDRGVAADGALAAASGPAATALFVRSPPGPRAVRERDYPPPGLLADAGVEVQVEPLGALEQAPRLIYATLGVARLQWRRRPDWLAGALADHLTSFGGRLDDPHGQSSVLEWIASGATASYGTVSEPCNHRQKFPHPQRLLQWYLAGASAIEAYWRSVAWPQQGLFVGEPLAAPFAPAPAR